MAEKQHIKTDIVVIGGGPVGLSAACSLSETGLKVLLVDAGQQAPGIADLANQAQQPVFDSRVSALTASSQKLLEQLGAWPHMQSIRICPYSDMQVWDGEGTGAIRFSAADIHAQCLGYIVENRLISAALHEQARSRPGLDVLQGAALEGIDFGESGSKAMADSVHLRLADGTGISAHLLIGADGANSFVREQSGFELRQWDYGHKAIVTTVKTEKPHEYTAWQRFIKTGPLAFLPLHLPAVDCAGQQYCSIVWSCVTDQAEGLETLDDVAFRKALGEAFECRLGRILESGKRVSFPLWQRHATDYVSSNIALVGDAAHTIHPLAGQGVNMGFADVQVLSEVIIKALEGGEDFYSYQVLSRYQRRRKGSNMGMMTAMEGFKRLFASEDLSLTWLRNAGLSLTDKSPLIKEQLMRKAMGL